MAFWGDRRRTALVAVAWGCHRHQALFDVGQLPAPGATSIAQPKPPWRTRLRNRVRPRHLASR